MKKHLLMLFLLNKITAETDIKIEKANNIETDTFAKNNHDYNTNVSLSSLKVSEESLPVLKASEESEAKTKESEKSLPVLKASEESLPILRAYEESEAKTKESEKSLQVLKAYEELLPVLKAYENYFSVLKEKQKKIHTEDYIVLHEENKAFQEKNSKLIKKTKGKMFRSTKIFGNNRDVEDILNKWLKDLKKSYLKYKNNIKQLKIDDEEKRNSIKKATSLYKKTIDFIAKEYPQVKKIKKLDKKRKKISNNYNGNLNSMFLEKKRYKNNKTEKSIKIAKKHSQYKKKAKKE